MTESSRPASLPPRWFIRSFWVGQRAVYSVTRGRFGLRSPTAEHWGMLRLRTAGLRMGDLARTRTATRTTKAGALRPLLGLLVIGLVTTGCTFATVKTAEIGVGCDQFDAQKSITETTEASVGDQIKVTLCSNASTGFSWQEPEISDTGVVSLADKSFGLPVAGESPAVGAAGTDYVSLKATAKGTSTIVLHYSQPWAGGTSSAWTYTLTVTVR